MAQAPGVPRARPSSPDPLPPGNGSAGEKGEGFPGQRIVVLPRRVCAESCRVPLLQGAFATDAGWFPTAEGHHRERAGGAPQTIFIHCTRGEGWAEVGGGARRRVRAGDLLVLPAGVRHAYGASAAEPWSIHWVHATGDLVPWFLAELGMGAGLPEDPVRSLPPDAGLGTLFEEVLETLEHGYTPDRLVYASQTLAHLLGRLAWLAHQGAEGAPTPHQQIARSIDFMKRHLDRRLSVRELAALAGMSASHYGALFRARTGYSPMDYLIRLRMHQACQWLDTSDLSVKEIALRVGYADPLYFSRAFRAVNEVAPTRYRTIRKG